jgi:hypothetical protein
MQKRNFLSAVCFVIGLLTGCARPDHVTKMNSPIEGVFYTVETYYGRGPSSDTNRVYANLERNGKAKMLVLEGENLTVAKITWESSHEATLCLKGGITVTFRNEVTLIAGNTSETIHNRLQEHCDATTLRPSHLRRPEVGAQSSKVSLFAKKLNTRVEKFDTSGRTLIQSVVDLVFEYHLPTAIEYADREASTRKLNLQFHDESVRSILESIIQQDSEYRVNFEEEIVDIFSPKAREDPSNLFNKAVHNFEVTQVDTHQADAELLCALGREAGSGACGGSLAIGQWPQVKITLQLQNAKVYQVLNAIAVQNGEAIWTVISRPPNLSKLQSNFWYIYPLQQPFRASVSERLANVR